MHAPNFQKELKWLWAWNSVSPQTATSTTFLSDENTETAPALAVHVPLRMKLSWVVGFF